MAKPPSSYLAIALAFASIAATGCGSSNDNSVAQSVKVANRPPLTKAAFIKRADSICERADKKQGAALRIYASKPSAANSHKSEEHFVVASALPPVQVEAEELDALSPPSGDEQEVKAIVRGIEDAVKKAEAKPGVLLKTGFSGGPFTHVQKLGAKYGFKACAFPL
jgi:hypothetical protein